MARRGGGGVPGHKGGNDRTLAVNAKRGQAQREAWKDRIQPGKLLAKLEAHTNGKIQLSASQIKSAEVLLDRLVPRLSSIEQTDVNEMDALILGRIHALLQSDPTLLPELVALQAREVREAPAKVTVVHPGPIKVKGAG
jgi:hypothetical protein